METDDELRALNDEVGRVLRRRLIEDIERRMGITATPMPEPEKAIDRAALRWGAATLYKRGAKQ